MKTAITILASAIAGAFLVLACSDDSPGDADAAVCDCPAAEAPITATRLHRVDSTVVSAASNSITSPLAQCPTGELLIGGSCYIDQDSTARAVSVVQSGALPPEGAQEARIWSCYFLNTSLTATAQVRAQALCLRP